MSANLEGFHPVFGEAKAELETAAPHALLPMIFFIHALNDGSLRLQITDFHANTWQAFKTLDQLEELRDEVGIGGSWHDFLSYLEAAFSSDNVRVVLGGPASSIGGYGATSAKIIAQKSKGMPRISISLEKLADPLTSDAMGSISVELFKAFKQKSDVLMTEQGRISQLTATLAVEKEKVEKLQKQLDTYSFGNKKRGRKVVSSQSIPPSMLDTSNQVDAKTLLHTQIPSESQSHVLDKPATSRSRVRAAPASRRAKQRGAHLADDED